jgi:glycerol-3-phosphate dehydrogenase
VSRDYRIEMRTSADEEAAPPVLSLVGGKWTTFRASAEHLANRALAVIGRTRVRETKGVAIGGGSGYPMTERAREKWVTAHATDVPAPRVARLLDRYGTVAAAVIDAIARDADDAPLTHLPGYSSAELRHVVATEDVVHLDDLLLRRSSIAFMGGGTAEAAAEVAGLVGPLLGWDEERQAHEVERFLARVRAGTAQRTSLEHG